MQRSSVIALALLFVALPLAAQTTSYSLERDDHNNTSAADRFRGNTDDCGGRSPGNPAAGNVSKLPVRSLLYAGASTRVYAHFLPWFCTRAKLDRDNVVRCNGHVLSGYDSNDPAQVRRQIEDMISRGIDGMIVDWYGPSAVIEDETTRYVRSEAEKHPGFEFALMEDAGAFASAPDRVQKLIADLNDAAARYYPSPAYMRRQGRPVVFFFVANDLLTAAEWDVVRGSVQGNPLFVFQDAGGALRPQSDGAFSWVGLAAHPFCADVEAFYSSMKAMSGAQIFGSAYQGFDDALAGWPLDQNGNKIVRQLDRRCGRTWLCTFDAANEAFDASHQLPNLQIVTWNDYDEGTEIESGIDNCLALSASIDHGGHLHWVPKWNTPHGTEATIAVYRIFSSPDGEALTLRREMPAGSRSVDLKTLGLPAGAQTLFVQAVGKPSIRNHIVAAGTFTGTRRTSSLSAASAVTITSPAGGTTVPSPVHIVADETTAATATAMQVYLDGSLAVDRQNVEHLDELVAAAPGPHQLAVKAWYGDGSSALATVDFSVGGLSGSVTLSMPSSCATLTSPFRVVADETGAATATAMQIYVDGALVANRPDVEHLDELVPAGPGPHQVAVKAWYGATPGDAAAVNVVVGPSVTITAPLAGAETTSPLRVVADETTPVTPVAMQVYVDGTLALDRKGVDHIDELVAVAPGFHQVAVKPWYEHCPGDAITVAVAIAPPGPPVEVAAPLPGATVAAPIHVIASENTLRTATAMQIYVDEVLLAECPTAQQLDELVPASPGFHRLTVKSWYADGSSNAADIGLFVSTASSGSPIRVESPAACATVSSPVRVVAAEETAEVATAMQVYVDGVLAVERKNVERIDELVPVGSGSHWIAVKAWYGGGCSRVAPVFVTVTSRSAD